MLHIARCLCLWVMFSCLWSTCGRLRVTTAEDDNHDISGISQASEDWPLNHHPYLDIFDPGKLRRHADLYYLSPEISHRINYAHMYLHTHRHIPRHTHTHTHISLWFTVTTLRTFRSTLKKITVSKQKLWEIFFRLKRKSLRACSASDKAGLILFNDMIHLISVYMRKIEAQQ